MCILILFFSGWTSFSGGFDVSSFLSNYLDCFIFPAIWIVCKLVLRDRPIPLDEIDFETELAAVEMEEDLPMLKGSLYDRVLNALF